MDFERRLLTIMAALALIIVACLASLAFSRWRRRRSSALIHSEAFRSAHVQPTQKADPSVADVIPVDYKTRNAQPRGNPRQRQEWERQTNHGMY